MSDEINPIQEPVQKDRAYSEMMKLFDELTLKERVVKTLNGLNKPKDSGDYKFAKLQIQLLARPYSCRSDSRGLHRHPTHPSIRRQRKKSSLCSRSHRPHRSA